MNIKKEIINNRIIASLRGVDSEDVIDTLDALYKGGIRVVDIAFTQGKDNNVIAEDIKRAKATFNDKLVIGTGNVVTKEQLNIACEAGTSFILSVDTNEDIIKETKRLGLISVPGAMTPSEITAANRYGADIVMIFPAGNLGLDYIRSVAGNGPLSNIDYAVCAGINNDNIMDYLNEGIQCAVLGSSLVNKKLIKEKKYDEIEKIAEALVSKVL